MKYIRIIYEKKSNIFLYYTYIYIYIYIIFFFVFNKLKKTKKVIFVISESSICFNNCRVLNSIQFCNNFTIIAIINKFYHINIIYIFCFLKIKFLCIFIIYIYIIIIKIKIYKIIK